jgi:hypothetical protein
MHNHGCCSGDTAFLANAASNDKSELCFFQLLAERHYDNYISSTERNSWTYGLVSCSQHLTNYQNRGVSYFAFMFKINAKRHTQYLTLFDL